MNKHEQLSFGWDLINEADIRINAQNFEFSGGESVEMGKVDMESLMVHELGHVLGLKHIDHEESVMATYLAAGDERRNPENLDADSLRCEYI